MIYVDANVFVYAYWKPKDGSSLSVKTKWMKDAAKKIVTTISNDTSKSNYCMSLVQISEICNILKNGISWVDLQDFCWGIMMNPAIDVIEVPLGLYLKAIEEITTRKADPNDVVAILVMEKMGINEIFTFDKHFRTRTGITCLPELPRDF
nr:type II toxin-antitoxin system VapC family toxin [Candidatus Sigynarchaeota archaeon]